MIEVWKYMHGKYNVNQDLLEHDTHSITRGHPYKLRKSICVKSARANFFSNRVINTWNSLPASVVTVNNINALKNKLDSIWSLYKFDTNVDIKT